MIHILAQNVGLVGELPPGPIVDPGAMGQGLVDAISSKNWGLVIGCAIMLIVWGMRIVWPKISSKFLPWIAVAIGALAGVGSSLIADPSQWLQALLAGVAAGLSAAGTWGLLGVARKKSNGG